MQQFGNAHFTSPLNMPQLGIVGCESVIDVALRDLSLEAARHRLHVAQQRLGKREYEQAHQARLHYAEALAWIEMIEGEAGS